MLRSICTGLVLAVCWTAPALGQADANSLEGYFTGKMVVAKIDLPGSEKGVDLAFNKPTPLDWKGYSSRLSDFGVAIHKGEAARITKIVLKGDRIEFQLNGGGFGTAGDDSNTTVSPISVGKSDREKDLEKQVAAAKDPRQKENLQHDLDRERQRRERQEAENRNAALIASQMKAQQVAERRLRGGSRFNLRWKDTIPSDNRNPDAIMRLLADYVDFDPSHATPTPVAAMPATVEQPYPRDNAPMNSPQIKRGMKMDEVFSLLGQGRMVSQSVSQDGLKTQNFQFRSADDVTDVTFVEGVVVRYSIGSN